MARRWAQYSAERALWKLRRGGNEAEAAGQNTRDDLQHEAARREAIARPALLQQLAGTPAVGSCVLRRNVALHARHCPKTSEKDADFRRAQKGPRLGGGAWARLLAGAPPPAPAGPPPEDARDCFRGEVLECSILERYILTPVRPLVARRPGAGTVTVGTQTVPSRALQVDLRALLLGAPWRKRIEKHFVLVQTPVEVHR